MTDLARITGIGSADLAFDWQHRLSGHGLLLRPLAEADRAALTAAAADPLIWAGHPAKTRHLPEVFARYFDMLASGGALTVAESATGRIIGCSRYYTAPDCAPDISIGFTFLIRDHWGGATNLRLKALMLAHAFASHSRVWLHIAPDNLRSQTAAERIGARQHHKARLDLGSGPAPYLCYRITREDWAVTLDRRRGELG